MLTYSRIAARGRSNGRIDSAAVLKKVLLDLEPVVKTANAMVWYYQMPVVAVDWKPFIKVV